MNVGLTQGKNLIRGSGATPVLPGGPGGWLARVPRFDGECSLRRFDDQVGQQSFDQIACPLAGDVPIVDGLPLGLQSRGLAVDFVEPASEVLPDPVEQRLVAVVDVQRQIQRSVVLELQVERAFSIDDPGEVREFSFHTLVIPERMVTDQPLSQI